MRKIILLLSVSLLCMYACQNVKVEEEVEVLSETEKIEMDTPEKLLRHVVLFKFNAEATADTVKKIEQAFARLPEKIEEIYSLEWGTNNSPEGLDKGLTHCFFVTFRSEEDRAKYLPHPDHQAFVKMIEPYVEDVTVVDYWTM
ncbi:MAG: Dabb family protein [Bacteroidota bacterium]